MYEKSNDSSNISKQLTSFVNKLLSRFQPKDNATIQIKNIDYPNSFNLMQEIISNIEDLCISPKNNKEILLVEIFKLFFLEEKRFKEINERDIELFSGLISFYEGRFSLKLAFKKSELGNKKIYARQFIELMELFLNKDDFFIYAGLILLNKKGYTVQNLLKYVLLSISFTKEFYYNVDNILLNINKNSSYTYIINKLKLFINIIFKAENTNLLELIYSDDSFRFIDVSIDILNKDILKVEKNELSKYIKKKITEFNEECDDGKKGKKKDEILEGEKERIRSKKKEELKQQKENEKKEIQLKFPLLKSENNNPPIQRDVIKIISNNNSNKEFNLPLKVQNLEKDLAKIQSELSKTKSELSKTQSELSKTQLELVNVKYDLSDTLIVLDDYKEKLINTQSKLSDTEAKLQSNIEDNRIKLNENKNKLNESNEELRLIKLILEQKNNTIDTLKNNIKDLNIKNNEINRIINTVKNRDVYKAIIDYINRLLMIVPNKDYEERIKVLITKIEEYMKNNNIRETNNSKEFINFLNELSKRIQDGNDNAHIVNPDEITQDFLKKIFPKHSDALNNLFKMNINDAIKSIINKKKAIMDFNFKESYKFEKEISNYIAINKSNFYVNVL